MKKIVTLILAAAISGYAADMKTITDDLEISSALLEKMIQKTDPDEHCVAANMQGSYIAGFGIVYSNLENEWVKSIRHNFDVDMGSIYRGAPAAPAVPAVPALPDRHVYVIGDDDEDLLRAQEDVERLKEDVEAQKAEIEEMKEQARQVKEEALIIRKRAERDRARWTAYQDSLKDVYRAINGNLSKTIGDFFVRYAPAYPYLESKDNIVINLMTRCGGSEPDDIYAIQAMVNYKDLRQFQLGKMTEDAFRGKIALSNVTRKNSASEGLDMLEDVLSKGLKSASETKKGVPSLSNITCVNINGLGTLVYANSDPIARVFYTLQTSLKKLTENSESIKVNVNTDDSGETFDENETIDAMLALLGRYGNMIAYELNSDKIVLMMDVSSLNSDYNQLILSVSTKDIQSYFREAIDLPTLKKRTNITKI